jgi:Mg-chelatase subunit ChlI
MTSIQRARHRRGIKYDADPTRFAEKIAQEARALAGSIKGTLYLRVNGTSDALSLASAVSRALVQIPGAPSARVVMYDYTKCHPSLWPRDGVHRTWSRGENTSDDDVTDALARQISVAVVVEGATHEERAEKARKRFGAFPVVDGTLSDVRPLDRPGSLVVLKPLGRAKRDTTGFVIR